jgi:hypothetical protein
MHCAAKVLVQMMSFMPDFEDGGEDAHEDEDEESASVGEPVDDDEVEMYAEADGDSEGVVLEEGMRETFYT